MVVHSLVHPTRTLEQLNKQRESKVFTDVTILVSGEQFAAHRSLLAAHSPVFRQVLEDSSITQDNTPNINLDGVEPTYFSILLEFIYTSKLAIDMSNVDHVSATSLFLQIQTVADLCSKFKETNTKHSSSEEACQEEAIEDKDALSDDLDVTTPEQIKIEVTGEDPTLQEQVDRAIALLNKPAKQDVLSPTYIDSPLEDPQSGGRKRGRRIVVRVRCPICNKEMTQARLDVHMRSHTGEKPVKCNICNKSFANIYNLKIHKRKHTGEKPYSCSLCSRAFADPSSLCKHKLWHAGVKRKHCPECGRFFATLSQVKDHMRTHTKERPFACTECGKTYAYKCDLNRHMREHSGDMLGPCKYCGRKFTHMGNYKSHLKVHERTGSEKVRLGSETFLLWNTRASNAVTIMPQAGDVTEEEQQRAVVKVADLTELMADGRDIDVVIDDGKLVVKERNDGAQELADGSMLPRGMDGDVIDIDDDQRLAIVGQSIDSGYS